MLRSEPNHWFFSPYNCEIWWMTSKKHRAVLLYHFKFCAIFHSHLWVQIIVTAWNCSISIIWVKTIQFFHPSELAIWWMTLKNNRALLLCHLKLCMSFHSHLWIKTEVTVWNHSILVEIINFSARLNLKFDRWQWVTIAICEFKVNLKWPELAIE